MRSWVRSQPPLSSFLWNLPSDFVRCQRTLRKRNTRVTKMSFGKPAWGVKWFNWSSMAKWNPYQLLKECSPILEPRKLLPNVFVDSNPDAKDYSQLLEYSSLLFRETKFSYSLLLLYLEDFLLLSRCWISTSEKPPRGKKWIRLCAINRLEREIWSPGVGLAFLLDIGFQAGAFNNWP